MPIVDVYCPRCEVVVPAEIQREPGYCSRPVREGALDRFGPQHGRVSSWRLAFHHCCGLHTDWACPHCAHPPIPDGPRGFEDHARSVYPVQPRERR